MPSLMYLPSCRQNSNTVTVMSLPMRIFSPIFLLRMRIGHLPTADYRNKCLRISTRSASVPAALTFAAASARQ